MKLCFPFEVSSEWAPEAGAAGEKVRLRVCHGLSRPVILTIGERKGHWRGPTAGIKLRLWQQRLQPQRLLLFLLPSPAAAAASVFLPPFPPPLVVASAAGSEATSRGAARRECERGATGGAATGRCRFDGTGPRGRIVRPLPPRERWGSGPAVRPRGAAAAEPEGRRAGQPSPRAPCRCPDLPLHVPVPPPAPAAALSPVSRPSETTDHLWILLQKLQGNFVPPASRLVRFLSSLLASSPSSWRTRRAPASGKAWPELARGAVGWGAGEGASVPLVWFTCNCFWCCLSFCLPPPPLFLHLPALEAYSCPPLSTDGGGGGRKGGLV